MEATHVDRISARRVRAAVASAIGALALIAAAPAAGGEARPTDRATGADPLVGGHAPEAAFAPGELIVGYKPGVGAERRRAVRSRLDAKLARKLPLPRIELVDLPPGKAVRAAARRLARLPGVEYAEPNYYRYRDRTPNDADFGRLWGLENTGQRVARVDGTPGADISAPGGWEATVGSRAVGVAVVDDGIDYTHPDLAANVWRNPGESGSGGEANGVDDEGNGWVDDLRGWDFVGNDSNPAPAGHDADHGTHVAGTIGAVGNDGTGITGVNWRVSLVPARVFDANGATTITRLVNAYGYVAANAIPVVNGSYGGGGYSTTERKAIAASSGTLFVVAAGNSSRDNDATPTYPCAYPLANVVCVAATDNRDRLASFSSYGSESVDLAAPGVSVHSTVRGGAYESWDGTSMATPHVAGAAALLWAADRDATVAEVRERLLEGVDPVPALADLVATGGRLNVESSLALGPVAAGSPDDDEWFAPPPGGPAVQPDTTPPATLIAKRPPRTTKRRRAAFRFRASEPVRHFRCKLDRRRWRPCSSPQRYRRLAAGRHVFRVRAIDLAGNVEAPATRRVWRVRR